MKNRWGTAIRLRSLRALAESLNCQFAEYRAGKPCSYWPEKGFSVCAACTTRTEMLALISMLETDTEC